MASVTVPVQANPGVVLRCPAVASAASVDSRIDLEALADRLNGDVATDHPTRFEESARLQRHADALIPGGAHTYAKGDDQYPEGIAPIIERAAGCRLRDVDGNELIEFGAGLRSVTLGHGYPPVLEAATRSMALGSNFVRPHRIEGEAAERIVDLIPSAEMVKFGLSGSDVTSAALRLARAYTGRDMVAVCREHPIFSTDDWFIGTTAMSAGIPESVRALTVSFGYNDESSLRAVFDRHPGRIAAVILEAETTSPPAEGFLDSVRRQCDEHGAVLILDEIITGFRWHERGAQFVYDLQPDLAAFGKAMANGFPLSALVGRRDIMRLGGHVADRDRVFLLSQTAAAQPWALAAMCAVIDAYEQDQVALRLHEIGARLRRGIDAVMADAGLSSYFTVLGRDCNLVYVARDGDRNPSQPFRTLVLQELIAAGVLAPSLVVSLAHDDAAVTQTVEAFGKVASSYRRALDGGIDTVLEGRPVRPALRARG